MLPLLRGRELTIREWLRSYRGVKGVGLGLSIRDPGPAAALAAREIARGSRSLWTSERKRGSRLLRRAIPRRYRAGTKRAAIPEVVLEARPSSGDIGPQACLVCSRVPGRLARPSTRDCCSGRRLDVRAGRDLLAAPRGTRDDAGGPSFFFSAQAHGIGSPGGARRPSAGSGCALSVGGGGVAGRRGSLGRNRRDPRSSTVMSSGLPLSCPSRPTRSVAARPCSARLSSFAAATKRVFLLRLLEPGASAGLNLRWDQVSVREHGRLVAGILIRRSGSADSFLFMDAPAAARGRNPAWWSVQAAILTPLDAEVRPRTRLTLTSCIWADQPERIERLEGAIEVASTESRSPWRKADALEWTAAHLDAPCSGAMTVVSYSPASSDSSIPPERDLLERGDHGGWAGGAPRSTPSSGLAADGGRFGPSAGPHDHLARSPRASPRHDGRRPLLRSLAGSEIADIEVRIPCSRIVRFAIGVPKPAG